MVYPDFKLESYLAKREFVAPFNFCASDVEAYSMKEVLEMGDKEGIELWNNLSLSYTETLGHPLLRDEIRKGYGPSVSKENVLCFAGAEEGIYCAFKALLTSSDHVIVVTPCYQSLESLPSAICSTTKIALKHEENWELDLKEVEKAICPNTKLIVINYPHNPTGTLLTHEKQNTLIELARKNDIWVFSDEVYRLIEVDENDRLKPVASLYEKGVSLSVMSKAYGLPGLRIGWIVCQDPTLLEKVAKVKHYLSICNSAPSEVLALIALRASETIIYKNRALMKHNLSLLDSFFDKYSNFFEWVRPKGGCIGYPLFKGLERIDVLADRILNESGVLILPGNVYDDENNHFRVSFGRRNMPEALSRFRKFVDSNVIHK